VSVLRRIEMQRATYDTTLYKHIFQPSTIDPHAWELTVNNVDVTTAVTCTVSFFEHDGTATKGSGTEITEDKDGAMTYTIAASTVVGLVFERVARSIKVVISGAGTIDTEVLFKAWQLYTNSVVDGGPGTAIAAVAP
jgi:hypothetical protein